MASSLRVLIIVGAFSSGAAISYDHMSNKIDFLVRDHKAALEAIKSKGVAAAIENNRIKKVFQDAMVKADEQYKEATNNAVTDAERMRSQRDAARNALSAATAGANGDDICYSRSEFNAALKQFDDEIFEVARECDITNQRLKTIKGWWEDVN